MREVDDAEVGLGEECEEVLADLGKNADLYLYVANQESTDLISESKAHMEDAPLRFMFHGSRRPILFSFSAA